MRAGGILIQNYGKQNIFQLFAPQNKTQTKIWRLKRFWAVAVAQLVQRSLPERGILGSNPVVDKISLCQQYRKDEKRKKGLGTAQSKILFSALLIYEDTKFLQRSEKRN